MINKSRTQKNINNKHKTKKNKVSNTNFKQISKKIRKLKNKNKKKIKQTS